MSKCPKFVFIGKSKIPIKFLKDIKKDSEDETVFGSFEENTGEIHINANLNKDIIKKTTVLHEVFHAHLASFGVSFEKEDEEEKVVKLIEGFYHTLFDKKNRALLKYLSEDVDE